MQGFQSNKEKLIVLSDLHVWGPSDPLYRAVIRLLSEEVNSGDKVFIVGDLFDLFVCSKAVFVDRYSELIQMIRGLKDRGVELFYVEGNHDFHLESLFEDSPHVHMFADSIHYEWDGRKFHFNHGDQINWKDLGYLLLRFMTRNLVSQCILETLPGYLIDRVGRLMSHTSRARNIESLDQAQSETVQLFRNYACEQISNGYDFVVLGHSHFYDEMRFRVDAREGQYINCGFPRKHARYFVIEQGEPFFKSTVWTDVATPLRPFVQTTADNARVPY